MKGILQVLHFNLAEPGAFAGLNTLSKAAQNLGHNASTFKAEKG